MLWFNFFLLGLVNLVLIQFFDWFWFNFLIGFSSIFFIGFGSFFYMSWLNFLFAMVHFLLGLIK